MTEKAKRRYLAAQLTWAKNQAKWVAAAQHFSSMGIKFSVVTENVIFDKKPRTPRTRSPR